MTTVLLADDQALVRGGFRLILDAQADIEVVGEASDGNEAVTMARALAPDVVLLDVRMPRMDGLDAARTLLARPDAPKVLMLTTFDLDDYVYEALRAGASGYLLKDVEPADLVAAVRATADGDTPLARTVVRRLVDSYLHQPRTRSSDATLAALTGREQQVLVEIARGRSNAEIADRLVVSAATAKTHVASLLAKLRLRDRIQAVILAYETGLVRPGDDETSPSKDPTSRRGGL